MFEQNVIMSLLSTEVTIPLFILVICCLSAIAYLVIDIWRDNKRFQREDVLRNYEASVLIGKGRLETAKVTGVLYSKRVANG